MIAGIRPRRPRLCCARAACSRWPEADGCQGVRVRPPAGGLCRMLVGAAPAGLDAGSSQPAVSGDGLCLLRWEAAAIAQKRAIKMRIFIVFITVSVVLREGAQPCKQ